jgi:hypothetical protein
MVTSQANPIDNTHRSFIWRAAGLNVVAGLAFALLVRTRRAEFAIIDLPNQVARLFREITSHVTEAIRKESRFHLLLLAAIVLLAFWLRLLYLRQPMCGDESWTFDKYASMPLSIGLTRYTSPNNHLFHTLLVHISFLLFGNHPWAIRLPAFIAGILIVPLTYAVVRKAADKNAGLLAAGLVATSAAFITYSTNARGYTILTLVFELNLLLGQRMLSDRNPATWIGFGALNALGFYTIPLMLYPFAATILWLLVLALLQQPRSKAFFKDIAKSIVLTVVVTALAYYPVIAASGLNSVVGNKWVVPLSWSEFVHILPGGAAVTLRMWVAGMPLPVAGLLLMGAASSLLFGRYSDNRLLLLLVAAGISISVLLAAQRPYPYARIWLFLLPISLGLCASGFMQLITRLMPASPAYPAFLFTVLFIGIPLWVGVSDVRSEAVYTLNEGDSLRDAEAITLFLKGYLRAGDRVAAESPSDTPLDYYFALHGVDMGYLTADPNTSSRIVVVVNETVHQSISQVLAAGRKPSHVVGQPVLIFKAPSASIYQYTQSPSAIESTKLKPVGPAT